MQPQSSIANHPKFAAPFDNLRLTSPIVLAASITADLARCRFTTLGLADPFPSRDSQARDAGTTSGTGCCPAAAAVLRIRNVERRNLPILRTAQRSVQLVLGDQIAPRQQQVF